ncbi:MAG: DUF6702 family protein [Acidobacteriota bacterium]|nr:DUF6702 family protein [Acidobacteriota bacterium]
MIARVASQRQTFLAAALLLGALRLGALLLGVLGSLPASAHPYHVTLAEMELNAATGRLEVALRMLPEDLVRALEARERRRPIEAPGEAHGEQSSDPASAERPTRDELLADLVREAFTVTTADGTPAALHWVGSEGSVKAVWLYFELDLGAAPERLREGSALDSITVANRLLLDLEPTQTNSVILRFGDRRTTVTLTPRSPEREIRWPPPPPPSDAPR